MAINGLICAYLLDMVAIRVWLDGRRVISTRRRKLLAESDIVKSFEDRHGPRTTGELIVGLCDHLVSQVERTVEDVVVLIGRCSLGRRLAGTVSPWPAAVFSRRE